ncbi:uncharacterized protein LOC111915952 isoform X1 [Lactuca sativa]|uniref:uncharacterized protein LOC111915952 isoform X1 n=1 Tax=Lactuca sativa TaxID=4236 RepID=UPI000CD8DA2D|nr:uncharacterized protein LOC111915952 isoform X1 [Lactuca sativa]XP_052620247.1 uncharacterized protein LOC111915952 isoform X1 [Lactuca sativa]
MEMLEKEKLHGPIELKTDALSKMDRLMLLQLNYVQITGSYKNFPEELRWLCMHGFPLKSLPSDLPMENVVALDMSYSNIESFEICYHYPERLHKRPKQLIGSCSKDKCLLGSLKILNLSFCEELQSLLGFDHIPKLERLILKGCIGMLDVCESIEQCLELVFVDLSYCNKLGKLPSIIGMLKKVETLLLEGCNLGESRIEIVGMDSPEISKANKIGIYTITSSSTVLEAIPSYSKLFAISLPRYLVSLLLKNNNLSIESFPLDFSCLAMLKELNLDENPIVSLPSCVRSLPRLQTLGMKNCNMLMSVEHPPHTLTHLNLDSHSNNPLLQKVLFDQKMSPLQFFLGRMILALSSFEFEGMVKIQPMAAIDEKVLHCLGWTNLDFLNGSHTTTSVEYRESEESEIQMYYEFGIFSTSYWGKEMPNWITDKSIGPSISFTVPLSPKKLTGLNCCYMLTKLGEGIVVDLPVIKISNLTKNLTWIYKNYIGSVFDTDGECVSLLSHWMFGMNEMEYGDHITINILREKPDVFSYKFRIECGVSFVYDDEDIDKEEEDVLSYYKSWNHIIGGDLSGFQLTTGEYILRKDRMLRSFMDIDYLCGDGAQFKDEKVDFIALSQRNSGHLPEDGP